MGNPIHPIPSVSVATPSPISNTSTDSARGPKIPLMASSMSPYEAADLIDQPILRSPSPPTSAAHNSSLEKPPSKSGRSKPRSRPLRLLRALWRSFPALTPKCALLASPPCKFPANVKLSSADYLSHVISPNSASGAERITGTLYGYRKGRVTLSLQDSPRCLPSLVIELALQTHAMLRELGSATGARVVLESEKRPESAASCSSKSEQQGGGKLLDEPLWTMFCNGKKTGYGVRREATEEDLAVMETLKAVSMGAGVLPGKSEAEGPEGEMAYMRGCFDHVVGSRDSESLYLIGPGGGSGPELAIFFVRL